MRKIQTTEVEWYPVFVVEEDSEEFVSIYETQKIGRFRLWRIKRALAKFEKSQGYLSWLYRGGKKNERSV